MLCCLYRLCSTVPCVISFYLLGQKFAGLSDLSHLLILFEYTRFLYYIPGKDQNHVLNAMRIGRGTFGLKYAYFSSTTTPLLDKLVYKEGNTIELGGEVNKSPFQIAYV